MILRCCLTLVLLLELGCSQTAQPEATPDVRSRVISLAPNLTELVFAAGAGDALVGVSAYSDYPVEALALPVVGDAFTVDQEKLALLQPDLLLVWESGIPEHVIDELRQVGYRVEIIRTRSLLDIAVALRRIGELTGHAAVADVAADEFLAGLAVLQQQYAAADAISVFYQVYQRPLYTINGEHYVSEIIQLCGGQNIFADLTSLAPTISVEAVIERDPEVMLASTDAGDDPFAEWRRWPELTAMRTANQYVMPADKIGRGTPRLLAAGAILCDALQMAREKRDAA